MHEVVHPFLRPDVMRLINSMVATVQPFCTLRHRCSLFKESRDTTGAKNLVVGLSHGAPLKRQNSDAASHPYLEARDQR